MAMSRNIFLSKADAGITWAWAMSAPVARTRPCFAAGIIMVGIARRVVANLCRVMFDDELLIDHVHIDERALAALVPIRLNTTVTRLYDMILHPKKDIPRGVSAVLVRYIHEIQWSQSIKCGVYRIRRVRGFRSNSDAYGQRRGEHFCNETR